MDNKNKFDLEKFENALELDEDLAMAELNKRDRDRNATYRKCPRCGTRRWRYLNCNERSKAVSCDKCESRDQ